MFVVTCFDSYPNPGAGPEEERPLLGDVYATTSIPLFMMKSEHLTLDILAPVVCEWLQDLTDCNLIQHDIEFFAACKIPCDGFSKLNPSE